MSAAKASSVVLTSSPYLGLLPRRGEHRDRRDLRQGAVNWEDRVERDTVAEMSRARRRSPQSCHANASPRLGEVLADIRERAATGQFGDLAVAVAGDVEAEVLALAIRELGENP